MTVHYISRARRTVRSYFFLIILIILRMASQVKLVAVVSGIKYKLRSVTLRLQR